jgi:S1-C subfamily serine protease
MVGVGTCSTESVADAQGDQPGGQQPVFESRLGVWLAGVARLSSGETGVTVREVIPRSGADRAGLREGDVLVECEAEPVGSGAEAIRLLEDAPFGSVMGIGLVREGKRLDIKVLLDASRREHFMAPFMSGPVREGPYLRTVPLGGAERLGLRVIELTRQLDEYFGTDGGVLISAVRHWSPADRAGLKAGDVVTRIEGHKVRTERDLAGALHRNLRGARLTVGVTRHGRDAVMEVRVPR